MNRKLVIALSGLLIMGVLFFGFRANLNYLKRYPRVQAALVNRNDLVEDIDIPGTVMSEEVRDLYIYSEAKVQDVPAKEGDPVTVGQPLIVFDSDDIKLQLAQCEADILQKEQDLSTQKIDGFSANSLKISQANLDALKLQKTILEKKIRELTITAPIAGRVSYLTLKAGEKADAGTKVAQVLDDNNLSILGEVIADDAPKVKVGNSAEISFGTIAEPYNAVVFQILPPIRGQDDESYSNLRIKLRVTDPGVKLIPGNSVRVRVRIGRSKLAVTVPVEAIHEEFSITRGDREYFSVRPATGKSRKFVYVLRDCSETLGPTQDSQRRWMIRDNIYQVRKVYVETGISSVDQVEILNGLKSFEQVVIYTDREIRDYDRVIVISRDESYKQPITVGGGQQ